MGCSSSTSAQNVTPPLILTDFIARVGFCTNSSNFFYVEVKITI